MPITPFQFQQMQERLAPKTRTAIPVDAVEDEGGLHGEIMQWLKEQVPQPAYIHARMDKKSGINPGSPDFTIFFRGQVFLIECKTRTGKRSPEQLAWALCAELHGFKVHEARSFTEFKQIINQPPK